MYKESRSLIVQVPLPTLLIPAVPPMAVYMIHSILTRYKPSPFAQRQPENTSTSNTAVYTEGPAAFTSQFINS